jgi:hypothetical protein
MELIEECTARLTLKAPVTVVGDTGRGTRILAEITGGEITGGRLGGTVVHGGDWMTVDQFGFGHVDVRFQARMANDALLYVHYTGLLEMTEASQQAVAGGGGTDWEDHYFRTHVRMESADPDLLWVNTTLFVAQGRIDPGPTAVYRICRVS